MKFLPVVALLLLSCSSRLYAQDGFTPTSAQIATMQSMNLSIVLLMAQAPGNFESLKGTVMEAKDGHTFYNISKPNPGMEGGVEMITVEADKTRYCAVFFGKPDRDLSFNAFFMMPHFGNADGSFKVEEGTPVNGEKVFNLLFHGTKVAEYKYDIGIDIGTLTIGMY